ncbi:relaxase/mobilization nuclease domain-containing protein [filamentous cyanobacterium LEGE 11480]|uniref:Relaxase/mobilization nuclease domain-containing protein n=1 Tax=Romeriopsis navalis LEGE 11480 TaxID=2777977 RepID=A0A928Z3X8_9CYAN|nr:relaxase/mobilization nuclease domain-containing protein [Romeriopsis navalis]MBE9030467.1 relaxase/mobilization nuclease domain-containing protein [Romeriopsis navalis LEGE 11480]
MHNGSFGATTRYVLNKEQAKLLDSTMGGLSAETLTAEFMVSKDLRPELKNPVWHITLSLPHDESLTDEQFIEMGRKYMAGMIIGQNDPQVLQTQEYEQQRDEFIAETLPEYQFFQARHSDREHEHLHIVASRINLETGKPVKLWRDAFRSQHVIRGLEREYGLTQVQNSWDVGRKALSKGQLERGQLTGSQAVRSQLQEKIEQAAIGQPEMPELFERLMREGIQIRHQWTRTGKSKGISYELNGVAFAGSQLGQRYSFPGLQGYLGVDYQADRDDEKLRSLMQNGISQGQSEAIDWAAEQAIKQDIANTQQLEQQQDKAQIQRRKSGVERER